MDFSLTREQALVKKMMQAFTENEVKPIAAEIDRTHQYPAENVAKLFKLGVMGMTVPKEYGGMGADQVAAAICTEELAKACASTSDIVAGHTLCCVPILEHGNEEQKKKYLPMLTKGGVLGGMGITEPNAGSDASKSQTEAKLEGDHYVINGSKIFITNGPDAGVFVIFAMTDKTKGNKGLSAFIIESSFPGFSVGKIEDKMGLHGVHTSEIVFTDMIVPKENLLGKEGKGFKICRPWIPAVSALPPRLWASPRAPWPRPLSIPRAVCSSASPSASSRTPSSPLPICACVLRLPVC